jgi:hypothetical protein
MHAGFWWGILKERATRRCRLTRKDDIKMDLQTSWNGMDWINLA